MATIHKLKTHPLAFLAMKRGDKNFDVRKDDRNFRVDDQLLLEEFTPAGYWDDGEKDSEKDEYSGDILHRRISYILRGGQYGIEKGYVVLGLKKI